jgi:hypothetical protein
MTLAITNLATPDLAASLEARNRAWRLAATKRQG